MFTESYNNTFGEIPYEILSRCSAKDDFTEWTEWRDNNRESHISLQGVHLGKANLAGADLSRVDLKGADLKNTILKDADLSEADLEGADLSSANLIGADLWNADLKSAKLWDANLKSAKLQKANLENAELVRTNLEGADLWKANLKGTKFIFAVVDRQTFIWGCEFDEKTVFSGGELSKARIDPHLKELMQKHIQQVRCWHL